MRALLEQVRIFNATSSFNKLWNAKVLSNDAQLSSKKEPKFNGIYSRHNLSKIEDGAYLINLDEQNSIRTHWIASYVNAENVKYFGSFRVENIPKEIQKFIENKNIIVNIYRIQAYDSIICGYFCIRFIAYMLKGKSLLDYTNLFSSNDYEKNDKILLKYFE